MSEEETIPTCVTNCTTHHSACDCGEWNHKKEVERLNTYIEKLRTMSTVEMMCENLNVAHHVSESEKRIAELESIIFSMVPDKLTSIEAFEDAIRLFGVTSACEWFGYRASDDFTLRTIDLLNAKKKGVRKHAE